MKPPCPGRSPSGRTKNGNGEDNFNQSNGGEEQNADASADCPKHRPRGQSSRFWGIHRIHFPLHLVRITLAKTTAFFIQENAHIRCERNFVDVAGQRQSAGKEAQSKAFDCNPRGKKRMIFDNERRAGSERDLKIDV